MTAEPPGRRILVAGVGNVLRRDDGFGPAVVERLGEPPPGVEVLETGIGGMTLLQELLATAWEGLVIVDAVDRSARPGTVFVIEPEIEPAHHVPDTHLANPDRVLMMAAAMSVLPPRVLLVGCQPAIVEPTGEALTAPVQRAVAVAVEQVRSIVAEWLAAGPAEAGRGPASPTERRSAMGHSEHEDERTADAAMANPDFERDREAVEGEPEAARRGVGAKADERFGPDAHDDAAPTS